MRFNPKTAITLWLLIAALGILSAAYIRSFPLYLSQPDGVSLELYASGDEYYNWLHDKDGYTVKQNDAGWYAYLDASASGELVFTPYLAGRDDPSAAGLKPWIKISAARIEEKRNLAQSQLRAADGGRAPTSGILNNLAVFIRFSDQTEFGQSISTYSSLFNGTTGNTMQSYFLEASYNTLDITTSYYPTPSTMVVSWQDSHPRGYYSPYSSTNTIGYSGDTERTDREFTLLANAVAGISSQVPTSLNLDGDNDGRVDNVCFIIKGGPDGWAELLWPHRWSIYDRYVYINGKRVYDFNFQLSDYLGSSGVGVLCHEMFHSLGAPDLYHYSYDGLSPVGPWDLMENDGNPPQHMGAFMKYQYGHWIPSLPEIYQDGTYTLNPLVSATNNCYKIPSPNSTTEYFVVEYRRDTGTFESSLPGSGLLVYRINTAVGEGNADGPPDEVYVYRPNGTTTSNGSVNSANYSLETGRTAINATTNPTPFLTSGAAGGLEISGISSAGATISFILGNPIPGAPSCSIDSPANGAVFELGSPVTVNVTATDADGTIANVAFYLNDVLMYADPSSPYSWVWDTTGSSGGSYAIKAVATDNDGIQAERSVSVLLLAPPDEGFESGDFTLYPWNNTSAIPWNVQSSETYSGTYAAKSGPIGDSASTSLSLDLNVAAAGSIAFAQKVSSESGWDFLTFYIDGVQQGQWSGAGNWAIQAYDVDAGLRTFTWTYSKDTNTTGGSDCAWLDHIVFPPHGIFYAPPQNLSATGGNGFVNLAWQAPASGSPTGYKIFKDGALLATVTGLSYSDSAVVNGTTYSFHLTAVYSGGESAPTATVQATPNPVVSIILGTGTLSNTIYTACPINIYFQSSHGQSVYTAAELNAAGITGPAEITSLGFNVTGLPALAMPDYVIRMKHTTAANVTSWINSSGLVTVWSSPSWLPAATGYNMLPLTTPFTWNGTDNLLIDTAFSQIGDWDTSGTTQYTNVTSGYRSIRSDSADQTNVFSGGTTYVYRPNVRLTFTIDEPAAPEITVSPLLLAFGEVEVGSSGTMQFTIANSGDAALTGSIATPAGYEVAESGRQNLGSKAELSSRQADRNVLAFNLAPGLAATYDLTFSPTAVAEYSGNVVVASNDADEAVVNIAVSGAGYVPPTISVDPAALSASLNIGAEASLTFTLANSGSQDLSFTLQEVPALAWFSAAPLTGTISGPGSQLVTATFSAAGLEPGTYSGALLIASNDPATPELSLSLALEVLNLPPSITLPDSFSFDMDGSLGVDFTPYVSDADPQTLLLACSGNTNVLVALDGFSVTFTAAPGWFGSEELTFSVFDGYAQAFDSVTVTVNLNYLAPPLNLQVSRDISGTTLQWDSVPNAGGYLVYRATEPGGTYVYLGSSAVPLYLDAADLPLAFYYVQAVSSLPAGRQAP